MRCCHAPTSHTHTPPSNLPSSCYFDGTPKAPAEIAKVRTAHFILLILILMLLGHHVLRLTLRSTLRKIQEK